MREDKAGEAHGFVVVERHGRFGAAGLVPDAEANMSLGVATAEVARDAERAPVVGLYDLVGRKNSTILRRCGAEHQGQ